MATNVANFSAPSVAQFGGSNGVWTAGTKTFENTVVGDNASYPRMMFAHTGLTGNYDITWTISNPSGAGFGGLQVTNGGTAFVASSAGTGTATLFFSGNASQRLAFIFDGRNLFSTTIDFVLYKTPFKLVADPGSFAVTGQTAGLLASRRLVADSGSFLASGSDAALLFQRRLFAESGSLATLGQDASLLASRRLPVEAGEIALTGFDAGLSVFSPIPPIVDRVDINGAVNLRTSVAGIAEPRVGIPGSIARRIAITARIG